MNKISACISFDPFEGDFGEVGDKTLSDKIVKGRKVHACFHCRKQIIAGELHRSRTDISSGEMLSYRWCYECCVLMAKIETDSGEDGDEDGSDLACAWEERALRPPAGSP